MALARAVKRAKVALVSGTTGLDASGTAAFSEVSEVAPVLWAANMSLGLEAVAQMARSAIAALGDEYDIEIQLLPASATDQRTQLARRLAAKDSSTDLMSLDPVFVAEFANAGWLEELPEEMASAATDEDVLAGAAETVKWDDGVYAFPQWANTQVLWYRKSLAEKAGLDMSQPVTWGQVIEAAADNDGTVGVQGNKYEAYVVWINALVEGAGGQTLGQHGYSKDHRPDCGR